MKFFGIACAIATLAAVPAAAGTDNSHDLAESRLNGCLLAGSSGAPRTGLRDAVVSLRALCAPQIKRVTSHRVEDATAGVPSNERADAKSRAIRKLNDEIALVIANYTGLTL